MSQFVKLEKGKPTDVSLEKYEIESPDGLFNAFIGPRGAAFKIGNLAICVSSGVEEGYENMGRLHTEIGELVDTIPERMPNHGLTLAIGSGVFMNRLISLDSVDPEQELTIGRDLIMSEVDKREYLRTADLSHLNLGDISKNHLHLVMPNTPLNPHVTATDISMDGSYVLKPDVL